MTTKNHTQSWKSLAEKEASKVRIELSDIVTETLRLAMPDVRLDELACERVASTLFKWIKRGRGFL